MKLPGARSIRHKFNFVLMATTLLALLLAGAALVAFDLRSRLTAIEDDLVAQADVMALVSSPALAFDDPKVAAENLSVLRAKPDVVSAAIFGIKGNLFATYRSLASAVPEVPTQPRAGGVIVEGDWVEVWRPIMARQERIGTVYLLARHELLARALEYLGVLSAILAGSLAVALLVSNRLQNSLVDPILAISGVARRVRQERNFELRAPRASDDEVGELADVFNAMLDELGRRAQTLERANAALRDSEERYRLAVRGSSAGLWDWDMAQKTVFYSPRFKALLGYSDIEFPDLPSAVGTVLHPEDRDRVREALRDHLSRDAPYQVECRLRLKSGEWRWFLIAGMAQRDVAGHAFRMAGSIVDVTERKRVEQVLQEANRAKDEFIATLAHELRNPLAPIRTGLEILAKDHQNGPASQRARQTMERQLAHMIRLIDDLLDISRINSGKIRLEITRTRLSEAVVTALDISRPAIEEHGHHLDVVLPDKDIVLMADATRLAQMLGNLLNNAAKYTPPNGRIELKAWQDGAEAIIEVSDNGVGIAPAMIGKLFTLFTQVGRTLERSQGGLGLGLYLVRSLAQLHGGTAVAHSEGPGRGSRFTVRLPCLVEPQEPQAPEAEAPPPSRTTQSLRILVVDDNVDAADTLATVLEMTGRRTRTVNDGEHVLQAAREFHPDVVLLDIGLPGMSGYDVARQLRADPEFSRTLLIAITGWGSEDDRRQAHEAGFDEHITKPADLAALEPLLGRVTSTRAELAG
jgi:PAS domain S-box-containing protein